jgi:hypothetical protein
MCWLAKQGDSDLRHKLPDTILPDEDAQRIAADRARLATFSNVDFQRARFWCLASSVAINVPRRLGSDASPRELTYDKKISRKVCHQYREVWGFFHKEDIAPPPPDWSDWPLMVIDPHMRQIGATVIWERQVDYLIEVVERRLLRLADLEPIAAQDGLGVWLFRHDAILEWELRAMYRVKEAIQTKRPTE